MTTFSSIDDIRSRLGITETDPDRVRAAILSKLRSSHPDAVPGREQTTAETERVLELTDALNYLDAVDSGRALVPHQGITSLVDVIKALVPANISQRKDVEFAALVDSNVANLRPGGALPRITLAGISALLSALWLFPSAASQHPVLKDWVHPDNPAFGFIWLMTIVSAAWAWLWFYRQKDLQVGFLALLKLERTQNVLFEHFLRHTEPGHRGRFSKAEFIRFLESLPRQDSTELRDLFLRRPRHLDPSIAEQLASNILARAVSKHIISAADGTSLDDSYVRNHRGLRADESQRA